MYRTVNAEISADGQVIFEEPLKIIGRRRAVVTILDAVGCEADNKGNSQQILALLNSHDFYGPPQHSPEEIEAIIRENRNAWGD